MPNASTMHSQSGQPYCTAGIAMITPAAPIMEPIERSNSPPIINIEAATAMMPSWAETSRKLMTPSGENRPLPPATMPKKMNTRMAPATAPSSGRAINLRTSGVCAIRSSTGAVLVAATVSLLERCRRSGGRARPPVPPCRLPDTLGAQIDHLSGVLLRDEPGPGHHGACRHQSIELVQLQELDRQIALQVLLLVDREHHPALIDRLEHAGRQVERAELHLVQHLDLLKRRHGRLGGRRAQRKHAIGVGIGRQIGLDRVAD